MPTDQNLIKLSDADERILTRVIEIWHRGSVWILGPVLVGLLAVGLALGSERMSLLNDHLNHVHPYAPLLFMPLGFALLTYLCQRFFPGAQGSGIPQAIAATDADAKADLSHLLSWRIVFGKTLLTLAGLGFGASIGREGPTIQIGAAIMHSFFGRGPFKTAESRRILILAGGAAGIAAAFNTPLAGIMFAIEELSKKHIFNANSSTLVTIIVSGLISLSVLGSYTYFGTTGTALAWDGSLSAILLCAVVGGAGGGVFSRLMTSLTFDLPQNAAQWMQKNRIWFAAGCGLLVAILGVLSHGLVFGTGYQPTRLSLETTVTLPWYFGLAKMAATLLSAVSGIAGGIFAPSLSIGAGLGDNIAAIFPSMAAHGAIVLLVMTAYLVGVTRAPVTSFIIAMEMTNNHQMLLPLMAASVVASQVSKLIAPMPLYHRLSEAFTDRNPGRESRDFRPWRQAAAWHTEKYSTQIKDQPDMEAGRMRQR